MGKCTVACVQMQMSRCWRANVKHIEEMVASKCRAAEEEGEERPQVDLLLLPELFYDHYFCKQQCGEYLSEAISVPGPSELCTLSPSGCCTVHGGGPCESCSGACSVSDDGGREFFCRMRSLAIRHRLVLPVSFYERANNSRFNSVVMIDAEGALLGTYRKSHIPDGPGYQEKFYFSPGDTGFKVWKTAQCNVGIAICWDQWFPEAARAMALQGADVLLYPTAIGTEPQDPSLDSRHHWRRVMQGHAAANLMPVIAANRIGVEIQEARPGITRVETTFYGTSFMTDGSGAVVEEATDADECVLLHSYDLQALERQRVEWGLFRDRRPRLYSPLMTLDGSAPAQ